MKQLMKRFATMALAIIVVVTYVPMGGVALADEASGYSAAQTQLSSGGLAAEGVSDSALGIGAQATTFAIVSYDGQNLTFSDEGKFADQIAKLKNKTVTIALHRDVSCRIVIPEKAKVTLNLNDNMLNRNLNKAKKNGEARRSTAPGVTRSPPRQRRRIPARRILARKRKTRRRRSRRARTAPTSARAHRSPPPRRASPKCATTTTRRAPCSRPCD